MSHGTWRTKNKDELKSECGSQNETQCPLCRTLLENSQEGKPEAILSIMGESDNYLPNETIKNQLKSCLIELIKTTNIWVITEEQSTCVGEIVEDVIRGEKNTNKSHHLPKRKSCDENTLHEQQNKNSEEAASIHVDQDDLVNMNTSITTCRVDHTKLPFIMIIVGGEENTFHTAIKYLMRQFHILVIDGSGRVADFIAKGYKISMPKNREEMSECSESFQFEMIEAAKTLCRSYNEQKIIYNDACEKLAEQLKMGLQINRKLIHVYSLYDTSYTLDMAIQDIFFQFLCKDENDEDMITEETLRLVDLWFRPDIAEREIFNIENRRILQKLQANLDKKESNLSKLFLHSLEKNRVEFVKMVLEYVLEREHYKNFLVNCLEDLYTNSATEDSIEPKVRKTKQKESSFVRNINEAVTEILGNEKWKPFMKDSTNTYVIQKEDIFKHLFIWAVLMNRREISIMFWKKEDKDLIYSALYASSLAKKLAENGSAEVYNNQQAALWDSSRYYEDLAYGVMTELYCKNKNKARQLLVAKVKRYNSTTLFELTETFKMMKFMGHAACQTKLIQVWKGRIKEDTPTWKAVAAFCTFFAPCLVMIIVKTHDFDESKNNQDKTDTESRKKGTFPATCHTFLTKMYYFYNSPWMKFLLTIVTYVAMLVIFSLFVLTDLYPVSEKNPSAKEYYVYVWTASSAVEEMRQACCLKQLSRDCFTLFWTIYEVIMYVCFFVSVIPRFTLPADKFCYARMMYSISLGLFIINTMQFFLASKRIGPKVIMIGKMMFDIIFFVLIFAVFVFGFGIIYQATMYPNTIEGIALLKEIIYKPYWQLYGELFLDQIEGDEPSSCTNNVSTYSNETIGCCPEINQVNSVLLGVYMIITHIILINLLIAMFSHTFTKVQDNNELYWKYHRFSVIQEYYDRSFFVPPFTIINVVRKGIMKCRGIKKNDKFKMNIDASERKQFAILERNAVYSYFNSPARLKRYHAKNMEAEKDEFEASYEQDTDLSLHDQINFLSAAVDSIQKNQEETKEAIEQIMATKQKIFEVPRGTAFKRTFVPVEVPVRQSDTI